MRILRVAQKCYPDVKGGGPYHVHALSRDQAAMGHDVTVLTVRQDPDLPHVEERDGYTVVRYDPTVELLGNQISAGVANYLRDVEAFDVVHAHSHLYFSTNLAALMRRLGDTPLAITNHGLYSQTAPEWVFDLYLRTLGRWTFNRAEVVFCYTEADRERVREFGVDSRIEVVANGIDTERFTPEGPSRSFSGDPIVLFVGRLVEGKQPGVAVEAIERVAETFPEVSLVVCGDGPLREELEDRAGDRVTFLGSVTYESMPDVYRGADLLVLPSRAEGTPRTIMEALASGVSVVSSDLEQVRSAFGDAVTYVDGRDATAVGDGIVAELERSQSVDLGDQYRWERTVEETTTALATIQRQASDRR